MRRILAFLALYFIAVTSGHAQQVNLYCATGSALTTWQPASAANPCPISGTITATEASVGLTGATVPASANYIGVNVAGNLRGITAVNPTGSVYAAQTDLASVGGTSIALGQALMAASIPVTIASNQSAVAVAHNATPSIANGNGVIIAPSAATSAGITPVVCGSAVSSCVLKAGAGNLYSVYAECSAACWLMVFNRVDAPTNGGTTAGIASTNMVECVPINAGGATSISSNGMPPSVYTVGITAVISSTTCATLTLATTGFINGKVQ